MKKILFAICITLLVAGCGGGSETSSVTGAQVGTGTSAAPPNSGGEATTSSPTPSASLVGQSVSRVNTTTTLTTSLTADARLRAIGPRDDGGYTVAWSASDVTLFIQRYDSAGNRAGPVTPVTLVLQPDDNATFAAANSAVGLLRDGGVVVAYPRNRDVTRPGGLPPLTRSGVYVQRFDAQGVLRVGETEVAVREQQIHSRSPFFGEIRALGLADGGFVVGWTDFFPSSINIRSTFYHQRFDGQVQPRGGPLVTSEPNSPGVGASYSFTADAQGGYVVSAVRMDPLLRTTVALTHRDAAQTVRLTVPQRSGGALLLPLAGARYALFVSDTEDSSLQMLGSTGEPLGPRTAQDVMPTAATELADGSFVALDVRDTGSTFQRFDRNGTPLGERQAIDAGAAGALAAALGNGGFAAAWTGAATPPVGTDVYTRRFIPAPDLR